MMDGPRRKPQIWPVEVKAMLEATVATPDPETAATDEIRGLSGEAICECSLNRGARAFVVHPGSAAFIAWTAHLRSSGQEAFAVWVESRGRKGVALIVPKEFPAPIGG